MAVNGRAAALAAALLSIPACASAPEMSEADLVSQGAFVRELKPGAAGDLRRDPATAPEADAAADLAEARLSEGDPGGALETARQALLRLPPRGQADRLREIRARAKKALVRTAIARGEAAAPAMALEGGPVEVRVALRNLSPVPLAVRDPRPGISPTLVLLRVTRTAWDIFGNVRAETWEETHPLPAGEAGPGGAVEAAVVLDTGRFRDSRPHGFVRYDFGGAILPSGVTVGELRVHDRIPVDPAATLAFPQRGWEDVAADPAAHLERGLSAGNPVRVLVAAACLPPGERAGAGARLSRRLRDGPGLAPATADSVRAALRFLGEDPGADRWTVAAWEARAAAVVVEEEP